MANLTHFYPPRMLYNGNWPVFFFPFGIFFSLMANTDTTAMDPPVIKCCAYEWTVARYIGPSSDGSSSS